MTSPVTRVGALIATLNVWLCVLHETTFAVNVKLPLCLGKPDNTPLPASETPCGREPPVTLHTVLPLPPLIRRVSAYVAPIVPSGRVATDAIVASVPKLAITLYGRVIPSVI